MVETPLMNAKTVHLGFEVGTGQPIDIPIRHMVVTGQTQLSGKTTTLEALVARSQRTAVAFVTKRAEGSFRGANKIRPYFRERADWQFVSSVLEATLREKLKFERSWIMRACKGARTLAQVHANVKEAMKTAKGMSADVYLTLDHYLDIVVPQIDALPYSNTIELQPGINAIDLSAWSMELQALVIRSVLEWVYERTRSTMVIIPEAWEFVPQNRGSPVLLACEQLIRKGGNLENFVWLDSQDIAGVHKNILRSASVWLIGVQREANEVKRALEHIPGNVSKPKVDDVMSLELGEFFACFGKGVARVYVQPEWMDNPTAAAIARGEHWTSPSPPPPPPIPREEDTVNKDEADALQAENRRLKEQLSALRETIAHLEARLAARAAAPAEMSPALKGEKLDERGTLPREPMAFPMLPVDREFESIYQAIKERARQDPGVLALLVSKPAIDVIVERKTVEVDGDTIKGRIVRLLAQGFYDEGVTNSGTRSELKRTGSDVNNANIGRVLSELQRDGFLTLEGDRYKAVPGMKVNIIENKAAA